MLRCSLVFLLISSMVISYFSPTIATSRNMLQIIQNPTTGTSVYNISKHLDGKMVPSPPIVGGFKNCKPKGFIPWSAPSPLRNSVQC